MIHVSRRIFDRSIDLKRFRALQIELTRSKFEKTDFLAKNGPFLEVFEVTDHKFVLQVLKIWILLPFNVPHNMVCRFRLINRVNPVKIDQNRKNSVLFCALFE